MKKIEVPGETPPELDPTQFSTIYTIAYQLFEIELAIGPITTEDQDIRAQQAEVIGLLALTREALTTTLRVDQHTPSATQYITTRMLQPDFLTHDETYTPLDNQVTAGKLHTAATIFALTHRRLQQLAVVSLNSLSKTPSSSRNRYDLRGARTSWPGRNDLNAHLPLIDMMSNTTTQAFQHGIPLHTMEDRALKCVHFFLVASQM